MTTIFHLEHFIFVATKNQETLHFLVNPALQFDILVLTTFLYGFGLAGMCYNYQNFLLTMLSVEVMYLGIIASFTCVSIMSNDPNGQILAIFFLIVAAAESALGLSLIVVLYKLGRSLRFVSNTKLRG